MNNRYHKMIAVAAVLFVAAQIVCAKEAKPLKVFILAGQSNMQEPAAWRTLAGLGDSPETKALYDKIVDEDGKVRIHKDVHVVSAGYKRDEEGNMRTTVSRSGALPCGFGGATLGDKEVQGGFGPELGFGVTMREKMGEPILIIKTAFGGKSLWRDFRPPTKERWTPPVGHPDHKDTPRAALPALPTSFELPTDFQAPDRKTNRGKNLRIGQGVPLGEINGIYPFYMYGPYWEHIPFKDGDLIVGVNGRGLCKDAVSQWRAEWFYHARQRDWKMQVTSWSPSPELGPGKGTLKTFEVDTAIALKPDGRAGLPEFLAKKKAKEDQLLKGGVYYWMMMNFIKDVLKKPGKYHPAYDPEQGYEVAGFVWFQGYNDRAASQIYPSSFLPRGFERYSWLLSHLIRNVRMELKTPKMPVVIGVFGQGGVVDKPIPFREGMAAPASYEEFKGTVAAVRTAPFLDTRIPEIRNRLANVMAYKGGDPNHPHAKLQAEIKVYKEKMAKEMEGLTGKNRRRFQGKVKGGIINIVRSPEEQAYLRNNISNRGFHYDGAPKFFGRAGEAFAEAMSRMIQGK